MGHFISFWGHIISFWGRYPYWGQGSIGGKIIILWGDFELGARLLTYGGILLIFGGVIINYIKGNGTTRVQHMLYRLVQASTRFEKKQALCQPHHIIAQRNDVNMKLNSNFQSSFASFCCSVSCCYPPKSNNP